MCALHELRVCMSGLHTNVRKFEVTWHLLFLTAANSYTQTSSCRQHVKKVITKVNTKRPLHADSQNALARLTFAIDKRMIVAQSNLRTPMRLYACSSRVLQHSIRQLETMCEKDKSLIFFFVFLVF